ncbi:MAG: alpha/beta hydrolase [Gemmatimonadetes bacterium]|nr:alpha/beta hydrolase [Gemmatimonadota bacterium]
MSDSIERGIRLCLAVASTLAATACGKAPDQAQAPPAGPAWTDPAPHTEGFGATATGPLHYLDWGGTGPNLILIHGLGDNPHAFDDLVPALGGKFRVVAYARRGHGRSTKQGPYDTATLVADLTTVMDSLKIESAHLAGWSMGGNEITAMAGTHPGRVGKIVYLDAGYDWADPTFAAAFNETPADINPPEAARASLDAFRDWQRTVWFPGVADGSRLEAYIRGLVEVQPDGRALPAIHDTVMAKLYEALVTSPRDYPKVKAPALSIYATTFFDLERGDSAQRAKMAAWEEKHVATFRARSKARIVKELAGVDTISVPGTHMDFLVNGRDQVAAAMAAFLSRPR